MLKISGDTVQHLVTWNLCILDTKHAHNIFDTQNLRYIQPFWAPWTMSPPFKCTHCGPSAEFVRLLVSLLNTCGAAVGVRKYAIHPFLRVYSDHRHRWVLKEARVHLHSLRSVAAAISQTAEGCLFECADGASFGRHLNLHKQVWCRTILIIFTWETEFRRLKVFFLATWHYFSLHLGVTQ